ncbi:GNAT family N-acetyltransferase [Clostridium cibarium]|uniref:GNAT family N-acetyltransferase n=1 Tax=Clostridium cibarium TaxID=2762247 RepID=A0ABR8PXN1_9CLOT|nr:GNAT family N-acetyltransferase [Clostridium cibarium]MBD7912894.1 GNAT family N-acetyltransferase [Clostridium cibarium]
MDESQLESFRYFSPFSCEEFCKSIDKYLSFQYIPCKIELKAKEYFVNLFKNEDDYLQIGAVGYGGIFPFPHSDDDFKEIIDFINNEYGNISKMVLPPFVKVNNDFFNKVSDKYSISYLETAVLDLEKYKQLSDSMFKGSVRTDIRYSIKHNVTVRECTSEEDIEEFYIFYKETMDRVGSTYYTPKQMLKELIIDKKAACLLLACLDNKIISGSIFLQNKNHVFYWINASEYKYRSLRGNYLILKTAIDKAAEEKKKYFNFGYSHNDNILKTKLGWGCELQKYFVLNKKN